MVVPVPDERGKSAAWAVELAAAQFAYDRGRPHTAIAGLVPRAAVNNVPEHRT